MIEHPVNRVHGGGGMAYLYAFNYAAIPIFHSSLARSVRFDPHSCKLNFTFLPRVHPLSLHSLKKQQVV